MRSSSAMAVVGAWLALGGMVLAVEPATAAPPAAVAPDCFEQLIKGAGAVIECAFPVAMTDTDREGIRKATRGLLLDATCTMQMRIERATLQAALAADDTVFQAPPQPVSCDVTTKGSQRTITFTFAPRVEFKGGTAVKASPVMAGVQGVTRLLSWPVVAYVNHARDIEQGMLQVVNAYIAKFGRTATPARSGRS